MIVPHNKQFFLSKAVVQNSYFDEWKHIEIGSYHLYAHPNLSCIKASKATNTLIGLGNFYDYRNPSDSNEDVVNKLCSGNKDELFSNYAHLSGENVLIFSTPENMILINDACAQMEVYYSENFSILGSQPKLLERFNPLSKRTDEIASEHFQSENFKRKKTNVGIETYFEGISHLIGNHYLDINQKKQVRFYPNKKIAKTSVEESGELVRSILTGYLKSIANRGPVALPVTAGIDSRVILTCALDAKISNLEFFTIKFSWMDDTHNDLVIPKQIAKKLGFRLDIYDISEKETPDVPEFDESLTLHNKLFDTSTMHVLRSFGDRNVSMVDGSIIGTGKNFFGKLLNIQPRDLARMSGYPNSRFAIKQFQNWLTESKEAFKKNGYHTLDMFFWEDRASNWMLTVKSKFLMVCNYYSIFNSRQLFESMLMTKRKYRDAQDNKIFNYILENTDNDLNDIPINPSIKKQIMLLGKKTGIYYVYRNLMIKLGLLKFK